MSICAFLIWTRNFAKLDELDLFIYLHRDSGVRYTWTIAKFICTMHNFIDCP